MTIVPTTIVALLTGLAANEVRAHDAGATYRVEEHAVEFHNQDVTLAGSLLAPAGQGPVPAVVFVHGAGRQTREMYREVGEHFASHGIAALIYDKRGTGESGGRYESHQPYENLVNDALAAVAFLKQRRETAASPLGIWGHSQGAYISAAAASRSGQIGFVIAIGASVADGTMFYYRDNLFQRYGLPDRLRDVAEKAYLAQQSLPFVNDGGSLVSRLAPRSYPRPDDYLHPAWSRVNQPVLAMWGQLDRNVPVGESVAGLRNSLKQANNDRWTMIVVPRANHDLEISGTGALPRERGGYAPGALPTMTDWAWRVIDRPSEIGRMKEDGVAPEAGILARLARYERLRWYGNGTVQAALLMLFVISFAANTMASLRCGVALWWRRRQTGAEPGASRVVAWTRGIGALNVLILVAFSITSVLALDQLRPSLPSVLTHLPLLGTVSALATLALLIMLAATPRNPGGTSASTARFAFDVVCLVLFVPYMWYWNLIGVRY